VLDILKLATTANRPSLLALRPDLPPKVDAWVELALAIDPNQRFDSVNAMWQALKALA
jgi:serine/threonine-protein kinase